MHGFLQWDILKKIFREVMQNLSSPRSLQVLGPKSQAWPILYLPFLASSWLRSIMKLSHLRLFFFHYLLLSHSCTIHLICNDKFRIQSAVSILTSMIAGWSWTSCLFALCAALIFSWIWCTYFTTIIWILGAGLLDEATLKLDLFPGSMEIFLSLL